ncbi:MAG TPA: hypothetical protein VGC92_13050 [Phenylobacterium sp.]|jgi:TolA-binding protein
MRNLVLSIAAASALFAAVPVAAGAAPWQSINQRQANLERRIDQGIRTGDLNRYEATKLRQQFRDLSGLEARYRRSDGRLTMAERNDLNARFDRLSHRIYAQRNDNQVRDRRY